MSLKAIRPLICVLLILFLAVGCSSDKSKVETFISEAQEYFDNAEYQKAVIQLKNAIKINNSSIEAHDLLAKTYLKLGDAQETFKVFLRLEQLEPDDMDHKLQVASFYLLGQKRQEAERRVKQVLDKEPENIQAPYLHAGILSSAKTELKVIADVYHKILTIDPKQAKAHHILARIYGAQKDLAKAEESLKKAISIEPDNVVFYRSLFGYYLSQKQFDDAESLLKKLAQQRPKDSQPLVLLANYYLGRNNIEKAEIFVSIHGVKQANPIRSKIDQLLCL